MSLPRQVFVSYKSEHANEVRALVDVLVAHGVDVWFAEYEVLSRNYDAFEAALTDNLRRAIHACSHAVLFTNNLFWNSPYTRSEAAWIAEHLGEGEQVLQVQLPDAPGVALVEPPVQLPARTRRFDLANSQDWDRVLDSLLGILAPGAPRHRGFPDGEMGGRMLLKSHGASASLCPGPFVAKPTQKLCFSGTLDGVPLTLRVTIDPRHSLLSPWELAVRQERGPTGQASGAGLDDRAVYAPLRKKTPRWYADRGLEERGLHLFWSAPPSDNRPTSPDRQAPRLGFLAMTCLERQAKPSGGAWHRVYVLLVEDPHTGQMGQIDLQFTMPFEGDPETAFATLARLGPSLDAVAGSLRYHGRTRLPWGVRLALVGALASGVGGVAQWLQPEWFPWGPLLGAGAGLLAGALCWSPWPDSPVWPAGQPFRCARYRCHIDVPYGWTPLQGWQGALMRAWYEVELVLVPRERQYPQLSLHVRSTAMQTVADLERLYLSVAREMRVRILDHSPVNVAGLPAYSIRYRSFPAGEAGGAMEFYKVGILRSGTYYLFQCSAENLTEDLPTIQQCIQTFAFESPAW